MNKFQSVRHRLAPQMKEYDKLANIWKPFVMFFNQGNFKDFPKNYLANTRNKIRARNS